MSGSTRTFNARAESVATKPTFRAAFGSKRLIVPADSFYEWSHVPAERRQPYAFQRADGPPLAFAGLYEFRRDRSREDAPWVSSCTVITTDAGADMAGIHDRQPVVLEPDVWDLWLDPGSSGREELEACSSPARRAPSSGIGSVEQSGEATSTDRSWSRKSPAEGRSAGSSRLFHGTSMAHRRTNEDG